MKQVMPQPRQTLFDIAVQHCGSADAAFEIAELNGLLPNDQPSTEEPLTVPEPANKKVAGHFANRHLVPATGSNKY